MLTFQEGLNKLAEEYGVIDFDDSVMPGICLSCETFEDSLEPDVYAGHCHECGKDTLFSALELFFL